MMTRRHLHFSLLLVSASALLTQACSQTQQENSQVASTVEQFEPLSDQAALTRLSVALRGIYPRSSEREALERQSETLDSLVDEWLESDEFGVTVRDLHNGIWGLRSDLQFFPIVDGLAELGTDLQTVSRDLYEAPLRLIEDVVRRDAPYFDILLSDYTLANPVVATVWGLEAYPSDLGETQDEASGWRRMQWSDGRPHAGILASAALFDRYRSNGQNYHRARAQVIADSLLCFSFLDRDIPVDGSVDLSDDDALSQAITTDPACVSCHQTLDPLSSYLWGHRDTILRQAIERYPVPTYDPERERNWISTTKRAPGFFGDQGADLRDLGLAIAADPRFAACTSERFWSFFHQRPREELSIAKRAELQALFVDSNFNARALIKALIFSEDFLASDLQVGAIDDDSRHLFKLSPAQLERTIKDLTGFEWTTDLNITTNEGPLGTSALLSSDILGFRRLAGGTDGLYNTQEVQTVTITSSLVAERIARHAAAHLVNFRDTSATPETHLLSGLDILSNDETLQRDNIDTVLFRLFGDRAEAPYAQARHQAASKLFWELSRINDSTSDVWTYWLSALLQSPDFIYY